MPAPEESLDPGDWEGLRELSHRIIDDAIDYTRDVRDRPLWQAMPDEVRKTFSTPMPQGPSTVEDV